MVDLEQLRSQQEQTLGTLDTRIEAMMERGTQAILARLESVLGIRSESRNRVEHSREASKEPRVKFNKHPNTKRTHGFTRVRGNLYSNAGITGTREELSPATRTGGKFRSLKQQT